MIKVLCIGKLKESFWKEAIQEYEKRLQKYTKLQIIELEEEKVDSVQALVKEKNRILKHIKEDDYVITLEIEGNKLSSLELSKKIEVLEMKYRTIVFVIGSSHGLHEEIKQRSNYALSFSNLTFPHQLFRVMLLEQIYRSYKIKHHENYHK